MLLLYAGYGYLCIKGRAGDDLPLPGSLVCRRPNREAHYVQANQALHHEIELRDGEDPLIGLVECSFLCFHPIDSYLDTDEPRSQVYFGELKKEERCRGRGDNSAPFTLQ